MKVRFWSAVSLIVFLVLAPQIPAHAQTYSVLYNFGTNSGDPTSPQYPGLIAQGRDGNLYSTGTDGGTNGMGTVFRANHACGKVKRAVQLRWRHRTG